MGDEASSSRAISRRGFLGASVAAALAGATDAVAASEGSGGGAYQPPPFELEEVTISDLGAGMASGKYSARSIVGLYRDRIGALDHDGPALNHIIELNPDADEIADALDRERSDGHARGPLHGIPVLIKDNIDTKDRMHTSAGSLALADSIAPRDSWVAERLRAAGAIILGKTNLSEWANFRSSHSSSGWSGRVGQGRNPYALDRNTSGSSSGSAGAAAASYCAAAIGSETDGSITSPSSACGLVGIKPTVGLIGRSGIVPISHSQDTAGPMARTVRDAAVLLGALTGVDPGDSATGASQGKSKSDYTPYLDAGGLRGARLGVARKGFTGYSPKLDKVFDEMLGVLKSHGAVVIDPADIATAGKFDGAEFNVLLYEFKADLNAYLAALDPSVPSRTLADLILYNTKHAATEMPFFGQETFIAAQKKGPLTDAAYKKARERCIRQSRTDGIDATMEKHRLDALIAPTQGPVWLIDLVNGDSGSGGSFTTPAAVAGYPHITVPMGFIQGLPVGMSFVGRAWSEPTLIKLAYAFEQATGARKPPKYLAHALDAAP